MDLLAVTEGALVPRMSSERWQELKSYPLRPDDLIISSFPRSGSNWTQHIVRLLRNGGRDDGINLDDAVPLLDSLRTEKGRLLKFNPNAAEDLASPRSMKVHLPYFMTPGGLPHTTEIKYIYIARNPKDVCVSNWHYCQSELPKYEGGTSNTILWEAYFDFLEVNSYAKWYGGWLKHVLKWWEHRDEPNIMFLKYEDMKREPHKNIQAIAEFMGMKDVRQEIVDTVVDQSSFPNMWRNPTVNNRRKEGATFEISYLRKGIIGDWKSHFTTEQNEVFEEKIGKILKEHNLKFDYE